MERWGGRLVLTLAHVAGMIDLVALPVWVGTALIGEYHLSPPVAGGMVTAYLASVVAASLTFAPRFNRISARLAAPLAFAVTTLSFAALIFTTQVAVMFALHIIAGFSAGTGLSFIHGTIGRSLRPHRLFAIVSTGLGLISIVFLATSQSLVPHYGGYVLFVMFAGVMAAATLATALAFPRPAAAALQAAPGSELRGANPIATRVWFAIVAITLMALTQAMTFSFLERIGTSRGFGSGVQGVLIALGVVNLITPVLAGVFERRANALRVALVGALVQACLVMTLVFSSSFIPYALAGSMFVAAVIVTHTFVFGWVALNDGSGRAVALTPAMLMSGAAVGPLLGGLLVGGFGISSIGAVSLAVGVVASTCYFKALRT